MPALSIAAIQLPYDSTKANPQERHATNLEKACRELEKAGKSGADFACLGETFNVVGIPRDPGILKEFTENALERIMERFSPLAQKYEMAIIAPILATRNGKLRNLALVLNSEGTEAGSYEKVHCTEKERERGIVPGNRWPVFDLKRTRMGIQICHDNSFPESARCLTLAGAKIIFCPHLMSGWGGEFMDVLLHSPAIQNGIYHVPVSYGCPRHRAWRPGMIIGRSSIIAPDATTLADAGRLPGIAQAEVDPDNTRLAHDFTRSGDHSWQIDRLNDRRPETYSTIITERTRQDPIPADVNCPESSF